MEKQRIRFVDGINNTLFYIFDGEDIEIEIKGKWVSFTCHYVDEYHFKLHAHLFYILEFAQIRETYKQRYRAARQEAETTGKKKQIRFVNTSGETFFYLDDGKEIEIKAGEEWSRHTCHYVDHNHFKLDDQVYHIGGFAQQSETLAQPYRPVKKEIKRVVEPAKKIPFLDTYNKTLFYINDGEDIEVEVNGEWKRYTCTYINEGCFQMDGKGYRISEFAYIMKNASQQYRPVKQTKKRRQNNPHDSLNPNGGK